MSRIHHCLLVVLALGVIALPSFAASDDISGAVSRSGVTINVYKGRNVSESGRGFVVGADARDSLVMASRDLVEGQTTLTVTTGDNAERVAAVVATDAETGIALVRVSGLSAQPVAFADQAPQIGDTLYAVGRSTMVGNLVGAIPWNEMGQLILAGTNSGASAQATVFNECGQVVGFSLAPRSGETTGRALDAAGVRRLLQSWNVVPQIARTTCPSTLAKAREQAAAASADAKRASKEAAQAQEVAAGLEKKLQASSERNAALEAQANQARARAEEAMAAAEVARQNAADTRLELERKTAAMKAETEALMTYIEKDRAAAEQRFKDALERQRDDANTRERWLIGVGAAILVALLITLFLTRGRMIEPRAATVASSSSPRSIRRAAAGDNKTEMHNQDLVEYVLDGRDEDGIRYLLRISGDQLVNPDGVVIGRNPNDSPYIINHADVSRRHARIKVMKNRVFIEDLGSTNGTSVNGQAIDDKGPVSISNGDQIIIGSVVMKLRVLGA
ncbi:MAG: FHA domain-containing protein [Pseudomonadales bacterium]|nr:FHA domain-containing protein [Pseudomonadales bacterium]